VNIPYRLKISSVTQLQIQSKASLSNSRSEMCILVNINYLNPLIYGMIDSNMSMITHDCMPPLGFMLKLGLCISFF